MATGGAPAVVQRVVVVVLGVVDSAVSWEQPLQSVPESRSVRRLTTTRPLRN